MKGFRTSAAVLSAGLFLSLLAACGSKGPLTMYAYEAPEPTTDYTALHRENLITIMWQHPKSDKDFIKGFVIERAEDGNGFMELASLPKEARSYEDRSFRPGKTYTYRVAAISLRDRRSDVSDTVRVAPRQLPQPPTGLKVAATNSGVALSWIPVSGDVRYNLYKSTSAGQCGNALVNAQPLREPRYEDGVDPVSVTYYCVRSLYDTALRDEGFVSDEVSVLPSIYIPGSVQGLRGVASRQGIQLIWRENPEQWVTTYIVYRKGPGDADFRRVGESVVPAWLDAAPTKGAAWYAVEAQGPVAHGRRSAAVQVLPFQEP